MSCQTESPYDSGSNSVSCECETISSGLATEEHPIRERDGPLKGDEGDASDTIAQCEVPAARTELCSTIIIVQQRRSFYFCMGAGLAVKY